MVLSARTTDGSSIDTKRKPIKTRTKAFFITYSYVENFYVENFFNFVILPFQRATNESGLLPT
jgi:hypothetical protein